MTEMKEKEKTHGPEEHHHEGEHHHEEMMDPEEALKLEQANGVVMKYTLYCAGAGVIPVPLVDTAAVIGLQMRMLGVLSKHYGVKFKKNLGKIAISTIANPVAADALRRSSLNSFIKGLPIIGFVGSFTMSIYSAAFTYALGKVFIQHFESGGTFLTFDPQKMKEHFKKYYEEGKAKLSKMKKKPEAEAAA